MSQLTMQEELARQGRFYSSVIWLTLVALFLGKRRNGDPTPQPTGAA